ncbi:MAG: ParB/RepB/Spo0J family partition protein [Acidobacteriota bacterium]
MGRKHDNTQLPRLAKVSAFFSNPVALSEAGVSHYPIAQLIPNRFQPRKYFDVEELNQLAESIKYCGVLEPLLVTKESQGQRTILAGERRWRAAQIAGRASVPVYELDLPPEIAAQVPLIENLLRRDLNPFEEMEGYLRLLEQNLSALPAFTSYHNQSVPSEGVIRLLFAMRNAQTGRGPAVDITLTGCVEEVFRAIGTTSWSSFVTHRLSLRKLPTELQTALQEGWLDYTKAVEIGRLSAERLGSADLARKARAKLLTAVRNEKLPVREVKARVQALLNSVTTHEEDDSTGIKKQSRSLFNLINKNFNNLNEHKREKLTSLLVQIEKLFNE